MKRTSLERLTKLDCCWVRGQVSRGRCSRRLARESPGNDRATLRFRCYLGRSSIEGHLDWPSWKTMHRGGRGMPVEEIGLLQIILTWCPRRNDDASDRQRGHGVVHDHRCQVSNGTETIMKTSVAENANASLLTQAFKHWWASIPTGNYSTQRLCLLWRMENENEDGDYAMWNLIIFDKLMWQVGED